MSKKFIFALVGTAILIAIAIVWLAQSVYVVGLWALWFGAINLVFGLYGTANVVQKKIISENYHAELDK